MISLAAQRGARLRHLDVNSAFLNASLSEEIYLEFPPGFEKEGKVMRLQKAIYGLKQAGRLVGTRSNSTSSPTLRTIESRPVSLYEKLLFFENVARPAR